MITTPSYRKALFSAIALHAFLIICLIAESSNQRPTLTKEVLNTKGANLPMASLPQEIVKAVSIDNQQVAQTIQKLKKDREHQKQMEVNRQNELNRQVEMAKKQRVQEQKQLAKLKEEANKIAIARKKQAEEEKKQLKEFAEQQEKETKRIAELKKQKEQLVQQQALETKKLAELNKKQVEEKLNADKARALREKLLTEKADAETEAQETKMAAQLKAENMRKKQDAAAAQQKLQANAEKQAQIAGEVDKYKALIINAIGQHWILPDNTDSTLFSQFRIRLSPDGSVLEVSLTKSSGDSLLDRSAQTAIYKASPLPVPTDLDAFNLFRDISLTVRPEQVRG